MMCGRFLLAVDPAEIQETFPGFEFPHPVEPRYNIAPSQPILAIANDSSCKADFFIWGLIPSWSKDASIGIRLINARAETLSEKPTFRGPYRYHRCLVLANGFYEWHQEPGAKSKTPYYFRTKNNKPFAFAGLWDIWQAPDGSQVKSCTIITTNPNTVVAPIHDRMPVILPPEAYSKWIDPSPQSGNNLQNLLIPFPSVEMLVTQVSSYVNKPSNEGPDCITGINKI
jgi:putative SOS response-associated peptidase YedK